jgi:hypothetical protein
VTDKKTLVDPLDLLSESLFGVLMTLTFTGTMSVTLGEGGTVRGVLLAALACNLAWGIVDGVMYVIAGAVEKGRRAETLRKILTRPEPEAQKVVEDLVADRSASITAAYVHDVVLRIRQIDPALPKPVTGSDLRSGLVVALTVVASALPISLPFLFMTDYWLSLRFSNFIAITLLFAIGMAMGRPMGRRGWAMGCSIAAVGVLLAAVINALGG